MCHHFEVSDSTYEHFNHEVESDKKCPEEWLEISKLVPTVFVKLCLTILREQIKLFTVGFYF